MQRPRPDHVFAVPPYELSWSFPSGHSLNAALVTGVLALLIRKRWAYWAAGVFTLLMGTSRVYLGHHWATDVLAGWVFGVVWLPLFVWLIAANPQSAGPRRQPREEA